MGAGEIILILFVYLMLFGAKGVPALAQTMGKAMYQFRNAAKDVQKEILDSATQIQREANIKLDQIDLGLDDDRPSKPRTAAQPKPPVESIANQTGTPQTTPSEPTPMVVPSEATSPDPTADSTQS
jgi:sec-independent protein translocase protein TatA